MFNISVVKSNIFLKSKTKTAYRTFGKSHFFLIEHSLGIFDLSNRNGLTILLNLATGNLFLLMKKF